MERARIMGGVLLAGTVLLSACTSSGGHSALSSCSVLEGRAPASVAMADAPTPSVAVALSDGLGRLGSGRVLVYLDAGRDDELPSLERRIAGRPGVIYTRRIGRDETFAEFQRLFAGQNAMLANIRRGDLPTSVEALADTPRAAADLTAWADEQPHVYDTLKTSDRAPNSQLLASMVAESDRQDWRAIADRLDRVEGGPGWATQAAATIRDLLERGAAVVTDTAALVRAVGATQGLDRAAQRCARED